MEFSLVALLRAIHVAGGAIWFGTVIFSHFFLAPTMREAGPAAKGFMDAMGKRGGVGRFMGPIALTTVLTGLVVYWELGYLRAPFATVNATLLTLGGVLALAAMAFGTFAVAPLQKRMATQPDPSLAAKAATRGKAFGGLIVLAFALMVLRGVVF